MGHRHLSTGRYTLAGLSYAVTTGTVGRTPLLASSRCAQMIVDSLQWLRRQERIWLHGYSVMPEHLHVVFRLRSTSCLASVMHSLKSFTAQQVNRLLSRSGAVWQAEYYEHQIRTPQAMVRHLRYVEENPVRAGLCERVGQHAFTRVVTGDDPELDPW